LCVLDHGEADAVLDGPARIEELGLRVYGRARAIDHAIEADQRGPADRLEHVGERPGVARPGGCILYRVTHCLPLSRWTSRSSRWSPARSARESSSTWRCGDRRAAPA